MKVIHTTLLKLLIISTLGITASGCSGTNSSSTTSTTSVSGSVVAGPASGASVSVKANGIEVAKSAPSAADGTFTVTIPTSDLAKDLVFEASGGSFPDEATSTPGVALGTFTAHVPGGTLAVGSNVTIDPSSTIVQKLVAGGKTRTEANTLFKAAFGYTPDVSIKPAFATISSASTTTQRLVGLRAAAFSQMTKDMGLLPAKQSELVQALADDLSDGVLDGKKSGAPVSMAAGAGSLPVDCANVFAKSVMTFQASSLNKSKLTTDKIDAPPFAKKALTGSYSIDYVPGMVAATQGKTSFKIKLSNLDGTPASGKTIKLMPTMHMATMSHSAPVDAVIESSVPGTYDCAVYYLMASGPGMGIWELKVMIGMETATFYPPVAMSMGTTVRATLKGVNDVIGSMMGMGSSPRSYYLFNDGSSFAMSSTFKLFIAAANDSMMMSFPAVSIGSTLNPAMGTAWMVNAATSTVQVSSDSGSSWVAATDLGGGHWSAAGLTGLAAGGTVWVKVTINDELKTTTGSATLSATNLDYALFTVVSGM